MAKKAAKTAAPAAPKATGAMSDLERLRHAVETLFHTVDEAYHKQHGKRLHEDYDNVEECDDTITGLRVGLVRMKRVLDSNPIPDVD